jgi:uncharacterized protein (DUF305 family)
VRRLNLVRGLVVPGIALALAGCGGDDQTPAAETAPSIVQPGAPGEGVRTLSAEELGKLAAPMHTDADVLFMQQMIHHHAQALRMTAFVPARSADDGIPLLAERMEISQEGEIGLMRQWLRERDEPAPELHPVHGHAHGVGQGQMPGLLTEAEFGQLERARGRGFDRLFLRLMIRHHEGALTMVRRLYASGGGFDTESDRFARDVEADQQIEIDRMEDLLAELG